LITGDDILIEYVDRLIQELKTVQNDADMRPNWRSSIEKFITHYVWHTQDANTAQQIKHGQRLQTPYH
jgi:hypothetical protein